MPEWDGQIERRKGYIKMDEDLQELKVSFINFKIEIKEFVAGLKEWQSQTTEYRKHLCDKIDKINTKFVELPCRERSGIYQSLTTQVKVIWGFITLMIAAIVGSWVKK